ncbi:tetratricopeptide repeat protein [Actinoplanes sp. NPDC026670]|uniref:tetratricopeptide repeat protein n=1 Tax=Actinoplanes sp. NPDC026670 TaxID=3154700 RepID=UPI00341096D7
MSVAPTWLVRIRRSRDGVPVGAGFLIPGGRVLTCAHVVADPPGEQPPDEPVLVEFQWAGDDRPIPATVTSGGWHPDLDDRGRGDVAVLDLAEPPPDAAVAPPMRVTDRRILDHRVRVYGYPRGHESGAVPAVAVIEGAAHDEWLGLRSAETVGHQLSHGYSGAPVWDDQWQAVVGMAVGADRQAQQRTAYAIPVQVLARYWPDLGEHVDEAALSPAEQDDLQATLALPLDPGGMLPGLAEVDIHDLGVSPAISTTAEQPLNPYVERANAERDLEQALATQPFVLLVGKSKSGKSRTLIEVLRRWYDGRGARIAVPQPDNPGLATLTELLPVARQPVVIWLENLERYLKPGGLDLRTLQRLTTRHPDVTIVATMTWTAFESAQGSTADRGVMTRIQRGKVVLDSLLTDEERGHASRLYPQMDFTDRGIGETMVAAPRLESRYHAAADGSPYEWAVLRAVIDWRRAGVDRPIPEPALRDLARRYLDVPVPGDDRDAFDTGLRWACQPVAGSIALVRPSGPGYQAFDYIVEFDESQGRTVPAETWDWILGAAEPDDLFRVSLVALIQGRTDVAERAARRAYESAADAETAARSGALLGELLMVAGDEAGADTVLRAVAEGPAETAVLARINLGVLLLHRGDLNAAEELLVQVIDAAEPHVAVAAEAQLGQVWLARETGRAPVPTGPATVDPHGDLALPEALARRFRAEVAVPFAQMNLGNLFMMQGELDRARTLLEKSSASGIDEVVPLAQANLGSLLFLQGDWDEARTLLETAAVTNDANATAQAKVTLAFLHMQGDDEDRERARTLLTEVAAAGHPYQSPKAADFLGDLLADVDADAAESAYRQAIDSGHPEWAPTAMVDLGLLLARQRQIEPAIALLTEAGQAEAAGPAMRAVDLLGDLLAAEGDLAGAADAYRRVIDADHPDWSPVAAIDLGILLADGEPAEARRLFEMAADADNDRVASSARFWLGTLQARSGQPEQAVEHLLAAAGSEAADVASASRYQLGRIAAAAGDLDEAETLFRAVIAAEDAVPAGVRAMAETQLGVVRIRLGDPDAVLPIGGEDVERQRIVEVIEQGEALFVEDEVEAAMTILTRVTEVATGETLLRARVSLGAARLAHGDVDEAAAFLEPGIEAQDPAVRATARRYFGGLLVRRGEHQRAVEVLSPLAEEESAHRADGELLLGRIAAFDGRIGEAVRWFTAAADHGDADTRRLARDQLDDLLLDTEPEPAPPALPAGPGGLAESRYLLLLGEVAAGEDAPGEAMYWFQQVTDTADRERVTAGITFVQGA